LTPTTYYKIRPLNFYITPEPYEVECRKELRPQLDVIYKKMRDAGWTPTGFAHVMSYATQKYDAKKVQGLMAEADKLVMDCQKRKTAEKGPGFVIDEPFGDARTISLPLPWLIAGALGLILVIVLVTRK